MVGDKLKIDLFQKMPGADASGGVANPARGAAAWSMRQEMSGVFSVQEDGAIVLPLLGPFPALNRSLSDLGSDIAGGFRAAFATEARIAVTIFERPPIYVVGPVKSPGAFRYEAGMTALHAIALSGGLERASQDQWSSIEVAREGAKAASAAQTLKMAGAELAVLRAERDGSDIVAPEGLTASLGEGAAKLAIDQARERRKTWLDAFEKQRATLKMGLEVALKNLALDVERLQVLAKGASARNQRVDILQGFVAKGMSSQALLNQAQAESLDNDDRALLAKSTVGDAEYKASLAKQELTKFDVDRLIAREAAIAALEKEVVEAQATLRVFETIKARIFPQLEAGDRVAAQLIEIVRRSPNPAVISPADPRAPLLPGDLVRVLEAPPSLNN